MPTYDVGEIMNLQYFELALRMAGFNVNKQHADLINEAYKLVERKGGNADILDMSKLIASNERKYKPKTKVEAIPNKKAK